MTADGVAPGRLTTWVREVLVAAGAAEAPARTTATFLVDADRRGLDTHGAILLRLYLPRLRSGAIDGTAEPTILIDRPAAVVLDGHNGLGPHIAARAVDLACERAARGGAAAILVRRGNHFGAASTFAERGARLGSAVIVVANSDPGLAPQGALAPVLGTNPLAIATPPSSFGFVPSLDMATSVVALGRVRAAARAGQPLPAGWAIGPDGQPTTEPDEALRGSMLPAGGHKGFALAFMFDVLAGCLTGAAISPEIPGDPARTSARGTGYLVLAINLAAIGAEAAYPARLEELIRHVHEAPRAANVPPFLVPGELEASAAAARAEAIPIATATRELLQELGRTYGVPFPSQEAGR
jgi:LDH2 family malate/lactate/ureidoglycolate dehydrogenase